MNSNLKFHQRVRSSRNKCVFQMPKTISLHSGKKPEYTFYNFAWVIVGEEKTSTE